MRNMRWLFLTLALALPGCGNSASSAEERKPLSEEEIRERVDRALGPVDDWIDSLNPPPHVVLRGARPEIITHERGVLYNGQLLEYGKPVREWRKVLPPPSRQSKWGQILIWDDLGLKLSVTHPPFPETPWINSRTGKPETSNDDIRESVVDEKKMSALMKEHYSKAAEWPVTSFAVRLIDDPSYSPSAPIVEVTAPRKAFPGYLEIAGVGVDSKTTLDDLNRLSRKTPLRMFYTCARISSAPPFHDCASENNTRTQIGVGFGIVEPHEAGVPGTLKEVSL